MATKSRLPSKQIKLAHDSDSNSSFLENEIIPHDVSEWNISVLKSLGISYDKARLSLPKILEKTGKIPELGDRLKSLLQMLNQFLKFDLDMKGLTELQFQDFNNYISPVIKSREAIEDVLESNTQLSRFEGLALHGAIEYIQDLMYMVAKERLARRELKEHTPKSVYTQLISSFTKMCLLYPKPGFLFTSNEVINGMAVESTPDIRLKCDQALQGILNLDITVAVVTVSEVKHHKCVIDEATSGKDDSSATIHPDLDSSILGQHGGKLLMDWKYSQTRPYLAGMIVAGTKVFFTLFKMTDDHMWRLLENEKLEEMDKAVIYISEPLDILVREERESLMESLLQLSAS